MHWHRHVCTVSLMLRSGVVCPLQLGSLFYHDMLCTFHCKHPSKICDSISVTCSVVWCKQWGTWVEGNQIERLSLVGTTCNLPLIVNMTMSSSSALFLRKEWATEWSAVGRHVSFPWSFSPVQCCCCWCWCPSRRVCLACLDDNMWLCPANGAIALTCMRGSNQWNWCPASHWVSFWSWGSGAPRPWPLGPSSSSCPGTRRSVPAPGRTGHSCWASWKDVRFSCLCRSILPQFIPPTAGERWCGCGCCVSWGQATDYARRLVVDFTQHFLGDVDIGEEVPNCRQGHLPDGF